MLKKINVLLLEKHTTTILLLFTIVPFVLLSFLNVHLGDDFWYANSFIENGFVATQVKWYNEWSGRYMATFMISTINPLAYGYLKLAFLHPLLLIFGTCLSLKVFIYNIVDTFFLNLNKGLLFSLIVFFYFNYLPDIGETFFWMAGAYTYQLPAIFFLLYLNSLVNIFKSKGVVQNVIFALFSLFVIIGSNEIFALYTCFINGLIFLGLIFYNKRIIKKFWAFLFLSFVLSAFMIFAPGNFAREAVFVKPNFHVIKSSINALSRSMFMMFFWLPSLSFILFLIPNIYKIRLPNFKLPNINLVRDKTISFIVVIVILLMVLFVGFFPSIYATQWIPQRAYTPIFFIFMLLSTILIVVAIIKIKRFNNLNELLSKNEVSRSLLILLVIITLSHNSNVMNAYVDLTSGKAVAYHKQVIDTYEMLEGSKNKDTVYVKELIKKPLVLPVRWPEKHNQLANFQWESYFKIKHIELE